MTRRRLTVTLGVVAVAGLFMWFGSATWQARLEEKSFPEDLKSLAPHQLSNDAENAEALLAACSNAKLPESWLLLLIDVQVVNDDRYRGFFETAANSSGIFLEYDPEESGNLRVGLAYGSGDGLLVRARTIRRSGPVQIAVLVTNTRVMRIFSGDTGQRVTIPDQLIANLACDAPTIGSADGVSCEGCDVKVHFGFGNAANSPETIMNDLLSTSSASGKRALGTLLTLVGMYLLAHARKAAVKLDDLLDRF